RIHDVPFVSDGLSGQSEAKANVLLVSWMNVTAVADIDRHSHPGLRQRERHQLGFAQFRPIGLRAVDSPVRELNKEEREIAFSPGAAPIPDHGRKELAVLGRATGI